MKKLYKSCSFTGYRTNKLNVSIRNSIDDSMTIDDIKRALKTRLVYLIENGFDTFRCGMAIGSDMLFAQTVLELREEYSRGLVKLIAVLPCYNHDVGWNNNDRRILQEIIRNADETVTVNKTSYFKGCMAKRNYYLVDNCDELVAIYDGKIGGTMQTVNYATKKGVDITIIDPSNSTIITLRGNGQVIKKGWD